MSVVSFRDRVANDIYRSFMRSDHFGETHYWNGQQIDCIPDEAEALKRKNNNVNDISWDSNNRSLLIHTPVSTFPGGREPEPNTHVMFDSMPMKVISVVHNIGVYGIVLAAVDPREMV